MSMPGESSQIITNVPTHGLRMAAAVPISACWLRVLSDLIIFFSFCGYQYINPCLSPMAMVSLCGVFHAGLIFSASRCVVVLSVQLSFLHSSFRGDYPPPSSSPPYGSILRSQRFYYAGRKRVLSFSSLPLFPLARCSSCSLFRCC